jgi:DNA sulfur modification protein DndC
MFRNWLQDIRDSPQWRCPRRRNSRAGPGPFTLRARRAILVRLLEVQDETPWQLISHDEIDMIKYLWRSDAASDRYGLVERG